MGKTRIIAETGAGQHGVATATVCALFGLPCAVYMGAIDVERQKPNVFRMKLLGAEVRAGHLGRGDAEGRDERGAARLGRQRRTTPIYLIGTVAGPHPYPDDGARLPVRDRRGGARRRCMQAEGRLPDVAGRRDRRRLERDGAVPSRSSTIPTCG